MMIRAILGDTANDADEAFFEEVRSAARDFIDKTTGIQTLVQMKGLIDLVRRFKCVPEDAILDAAGYKRVYNDALITMVNARIRQLETGELAVEDFAIKKAHELLRALAQKQTILYLASGTDVEDVRREAEILGFAQYFGSRIYGAVGDMTKEAKRIVLERIMNDIGEDAHKRILTFGDGPVEIRETHNGGYTVGVATKYVATDWKCGNARGSSRRGPISSFQITARLIHSCRCSLHEPSPDTGANRQPVGMRRQCGDVSIDHELQP
jgi:phosphoglycolate phosphatase-like HAD superfamily hydrolase